MIKHSPYAPPMPTRPPRRHSWLRSLVLFFVLLCILAGASLYARPDLVPQAVDLARAVFGAQAVAQVESWVFQAQDSVRQARYHATGSTPTIRWAAPSASQPAVSAPTAPPAQPGPSAAPSGAAGPAALNWSPFMSTASGAPALQRAIVTPDPTRPYVATALVRIDLRATQLHLVAGTQEPISSVRVARPGSIPAADQRSGALLAAFNGGFKAANGAFGMGVGKTVLLPPTDGLATLAIYRDGSVRLGAWGSDITASPDLVAWRQNCPLLLDGGLPTGTADQEDPKLWGKTVHNVVATWRSGLGISADGRYLIYAAGDGLTISALANALASGGASRAMQLDINSWWVRFVTYTPGAGGHLVAQKLLTEMVGDARQFLAPDTRDFFYLTARS